MNKGKIVKMMKKWWIMAVVITLILPLISCAKKKKDSLQAEFGRLECVGSIGNFVTYVINSRNNPGTYELVIIPTQVDRPGDIASITIANNTKAYKQVVPQVVLNNGDEIFAGYVTENDLQVYNILAITPYDPTTNFADQTPVKDAFCQMPQLGDDYGN